MCWNAWWPVGMITREQMDNALAQPLRFQPNRYPFLAPHFCDMLVPTTGRRCHRGQDDPRSGPAADRRGIRWRNTRRPCVPTASAARRWSCWTPRRARFSRWSARRISVRQFEGAQVNAAARAALRRIDPQAVRLCAGDRPRDCSPRCGCSMMCRKVTATTIRRTSTRPSRGGDGAGRPGPFAQPAGDRGGEATSANRCSMPRSANWDSARYPNRRSTTGSGWCSATREVTLLDLTNAYACLARGGIYLPWRTTPSARSGRHTGVFRGGLLVDLRHPGRRRARDGFHRHRGGHPDSAIGLENRHLLGFPRRVDDRLQPGICDRRLAWEIRMAGRPRALVGRKAAAPVVWDICRRLYPSGNGPWFAKPDAIESREVCALTGQAPCPNCQRVVRDHAIAGVSRYRDLRGAPLRPRGGLAGAGGGVSEKSAGPPAPAGTRANW